MRGRLDDPFADIDVAVDERLGMSTRRDLARAQDEAGKSRRFPGLHVFFNDASLGRAIRRLKITGAGATASVAGDTVTLSIGGGSGSGAPTTSTYITRTADAGLSNEFALSTLSDGILKHSGGTPAQAVAGTDYGLPLTVQEGGVNRDTATAQINFDGSDFDVSNPGAGQVGVSLNYGTGAAQPAEGNHTHEPDHLDYTFKAVNKNPGAATVTAVGIAAPTLTATASNTDAADGPWLNHATGAVSGNASGVVSAFTQLRRDWSPSISFTVKTPASAASVRWWVGVFSNTVDASATPSVHMAAFRYDTTADGTAFWRCVTNNGGAASHSVQATSVAVTTDTVYFFKIKLLASSVDFYINGTLVHTSSTALPTATQLLGYGVRVTTLAASAQNIKWGRIAIQQPY